MPGTLLKWVVFNVLFWEREKRTERWSHPKERVHFCKELFWVTDLTFLVKYGQLLFEGRKFSFTSLIIQQYFSSREFSTKKKIERSTKSSQAHRSQPWQYVYVYARRVDPSALAFSLSSHRDSSIGLLFSSQKLNHKSHPKCDRKQWCRTAQPHVR